MNIDIEEILQLLNQTLINRQVLMQHDMARMSFRCTTVAARDHREFKLLVDSYVQHHMRSVGSSLTEAQCHGEAVRILMSAFNQDPYQEGYARALQMGLDGANGGMRLVFDEIANALKRRAMNEYIEHVYHERINVLSKDAARALAQAFCQEFGPILRRFNVPMDPDTFAWNPRAALEYYRQAIESILGVAKKI